MKRFIKGDPVRSMDEFAQQKYVWMNNKIYHRGWFESWQFRYVKINIQQGWIYKCIDLNQVSTIADRLLEMDNM